MKKGLIIALAAGLFLGAGLSVKAQDGEYKATPVTISRDKVRQNGKLYYSHVVLERQTLFSISKAYGVSIEDIYAANPALKLETEGLKTYQILMIPIMDNAREQAVEDEKPAAAPSVGTMISQASATAGPQEYIIHTVKWYEDLGAISRKYGVSKEAIMRANGMTSQSVSRKQKLRIPQGEYAEDIPEVADIEEVEVAEEETEKERGNIFETIGEAISEKAEELFYTGKKDVSSALVLPFNAQKQPNDNNLDFYSGVLLAVKDLKDEGIKLDLDVYDVTGGNIPASEKNFGAYDFVLGPVSTADITNAMKVSQSGTTFISPLEPKASELAYQHSNFVQAPSSSENQCEDLVKWVEEDFRSGDRIILFTEKGKSGTSATSALISELQASGLQYSTISYGLLEGRNIASSIENAASQEGTVRMIIASESEAFVSDVVRNANLVAHRNYNIALYCPSKIRSFETIEVENLHNTNLHVSISYYVDYDSPKVQRFLMEYRALFNTEPGPFAFQGYDTACTFARLCSQYGKRWPDKLGSATAKGLQSNFSFESTAAGGYMNKAVRRIVYGPDFSIRLVN